jgi:RHS repeat-associated protein
LTLIATIRDPSVTSYRDTTAAPGHTYTYKIVTNGSAASNQQRVALPNDGQATTILQPSFQDGKATTLDYDGSAADSCLNWGSTRPLRVGADGFTDRSVLGFDLSGIPAGAQISSASLSLYNDSPPAAAMTIGAYRMTSSWKEGTGAGTACTGDASWLQSQGGVNWASPGGDFDPAAVASVSHGSNDAPRWDTYDIASLVQKWADGTAPNLGVMLKATDETAVQGKSLVYISDDYAPTASLQPKLSVTYFDGSHSQGPVVAMSSPAPGDTVGGWVTVAATASDDRRVDAIQYLVDGTPIGTVGCVCSDMWNSTSVSRGPHTLTAKAFDDAGNVTTSAPVSVTVGNSAPPNTRITFPTQLYRDQVLFDAPAAYWPLNEERGTTTVAADVSPHFRDGTYGGSVSASQPGFVSGDFDSVLFQNADTDGVVTVSTLSGVLGSALTAEAWVKYGGISTAGAFDDVVARNWGSAGGWMLGVYKDANGVQRAHFGVNVGGTVIAATAPVTPGTLYLAGTYDGATARLYVNGSEVANAAASGAALDTSSNVLIGGNLNDDITIDEPAVYGTALSADRLKQHYDVGSGRPPTVKGTATIQATANDDGGVSKVEFYVDGTRFDTDTTAPYTGSLRTLDAVSPVYDGTHVLTTKAYDGDGHVTTSADSNVVVANAAGTKYQAGFGSTAVPQAMTFDPNAASQQQAGVQVTVTNKGSSALSASDVVLRYRWYSPDPANPNPVVSDGPTTSLGADLAPGASKTVTVMVSPPSLPDGVERAQYKLRFDLFEQSTSTFFADKGNPPLDNPVIVNKALLDHLGLERYWHYEGEDIGAGMQQLVNVSNGNSLLRLTPWDEPGRGLSTVLDLTYNSLEKKSESPIGNNFSLSVSSLTRFGNPIDIHPNQADSIAGRANRFIDIADGDGTSHRFVGQQASDGTVFWQEPAGVHLYLRHYSDTDATKAWAFTRPDRTTFFYDSGGFPTGVEDANGNRISYTLENTPPGDDPGAPKKRITAVTDAAGQGASQAPNRSFNISYYSKADGKQPAVRGKIKQITDHAGHALRFDYYEDGNLLRITQVGGLNTDGSPLADRSWVFTYTTSAGDGPAIPNATDRVSPDPKTSDESTRIYSVRDPRGKETTFAYLGSGAGQDRWKLSSRTERDGTQTSFAYDDAGRTTTVTEPLSRVSKYQYDADGKVTTITNPNNEVSTIEWNADREVHKLNEPSGAFTEYLYNDNGYLTDVFDQLRNHAQLTYNNTGVDSNDASGKWAAGRTIPHVSDLATKTNPRGTATASPTDDFQWQFQYDSKGNLKQVSDPARVSTTFTYNANGTLATATDANTHVTSYPSYDANGLPTEIDDPAGDVTKFGYDDAGRLLFVQDANHQSASQTSSSNPRDYRDYFDYDSFGRLGRQSAPKSTAIEPGRLIWSDASYDENDNLVKEIAPHFGAQDTLSGSVTTHAYDSMDRVMLDTLPDNSDSPADAGREKTTYTYDNAGRLTSVTQPRGVATTGTDKDFATFLSYDPLDRVTKRTRYDVDSTGAITKTLNTLNCYDIAGDLRSVTTPRAGVASVTCSPYANASFTTKYDYDADHRLLATTDPLGHKQSQTYDANGNVASTTDAQNTTEQLMYDQRDQLIKDVQPFDTGRTLTTEYEYDPAGNLKRLISPRAYDASSDKSTFTNYVTSYTYDAADRLTRTDLPKDTSTGQEYQLRGYDPNGNLTLTSLPVTDPDPTHLTTDQKTTLTYFDPGWIRTANDPSDPTNRFDYRAEGWQSLRAVQSGGTDDPKRTSTWEYFPNGGLKAEHSRDGQPTSYTYDADNNLATANSSRGVGSSTEAAMSITASYDGFDRLTKTRDQKSGDSISHVSTMAYDDDNNLTQTVANAVEGSTTQTGRENDYGYDGADWLSDQTDHGADNSSTSDDRHITFAFLPTGWQQNRTIQKAGSTKESTDWTYFQNGQLKTLNTKNGSGATMESHNVSYVDSGVYLNGNRAQDVYSLHGPGGGPCASSCTAKYSYDALDRLTHEHTDRGDGSNLDIGYTLDPAGDVTQQRTNGATVNYSYVGQQLRQQLDASNNVVARYFYDGHGRLDCVTTAAGSAASCDSAGTPSPDSSLVSSYSYDPLDRLLVSHTYANPNAGIKGKNAVYTYDALDRPTKEVEDHDGAATNTTNLMYLGLSDELTHEGHTYSDGQPARTKDYSYDPFGNRLSLSYQRSGDPAKDFYYGYDTHGSVSLLLNDAGGAQASYGYTAYGDTDPAITDERDPDTGGDSGCSKPVNDKPATGQLGCVNPTNQYRYTGKRLDPGSGTLDMGARRFSPDPGRYLQEDQLDGALGDLQLSDDPLTGDRYGLAGANPVNFVEADGHTPYLPGEGGNPTRRPRPASSSSTSNLVSAVPQLRPLGSLAPPSLSGGSGGPLSAIGGALGGIATGVGQSLAEVGTGVYETAKQRFENPALSQTRPDPLTEAALHPRDAGRALVAPYLHGPLTQRIGRGITDLALTFTGLKAAGVAGDLAGVEAASTAATGGIAPVAQGAAGVERTIGEIEAAGGRILGREVTVSAGGRRTRPDLFAELPNGSRAFVEVKTGRSARLSANQLAAFPKLISEGGIPYGTNAAAAGLEPGTPFGPLPVYVVRQPWPLP